MDCQQKAAGDTDSKGSRPRQTKYCPKGNVQTHKVGGKIKMSIESNEQSRS